MRVRSRGGILLSLAATACGALAGALEPPAVLVPRVLECRGEVRHHVEVPLGSVAAVVGLSYSEQQAGCSAWFHSPAQSSDINFAIHLVTKDGMSELSCTPRFADRREGWVRIAFPQELVDEAKSDCPDRLAVLVEQASPGVEPLPRFPVAWSVKNAAAPFGGAAPRAEYLLRLSGGSKQYGVKFRGSRSSSAAPCKPEVHSRVWDFECTVSPAEEVIQWDWVSVETRNWTSLRIVGAPLVPKDQP